MAIRVQEVDTVRHKSDSSEKIFKLYEGRKERSEQKL
jgi:hypothetical protein